MKIKITNIIILFFALAAQASTYKMFPEKGQITFLAKGKPALISIKGEGEGAMATLTETNKTLNGVITFKLNTLKTGIELRDDHLKNKYLEVEKYPMATLTVLELKLPEDLKKEFSFKGSLNLHGIDQPVEGIASLAGDLKAPKLSAEFKIKLSQFKIETPNFKGITVAEDVQIKVAVPVLKEE